MRLIITRHGQTRKNLQKIILGQEINDLLDEEGIEQDKKLAQRLKEEKIDFVYTSDLKRAVKTAEEILKFHPSVPMVIAPQLLEWKAGIYSGQLMEDNNKEKDREKFGLAFDMFKPKSGESYVELQERLKPFLKVLTEKHKNENVLLVSHTVTVTILLLTLLNLSITKENYKKWRPANVSVNIFEFSDNGKAHLYLFNNTEHLGSKIEVL